MIHTHNDNSVNFLSPGSGGMEGGEDFGGSLSCQGNVGEGGGSVVPNGIFRGWYIIANHKRAMVLGPLLFMLHAEKEYRSAFAFGRHFFFFRVLCEGQRVFAGN